MNNSTRPDATGPIRDVARALAASDQPGASFAALDRALDAAIGHRLFTVLVVNMAARENQRVYTSRPQAYPVGGTKPIVPDSPAMREVIEAGRARITRNVEELIAGFPDHELIRSLGCESCINVPVRWNGETLGMLNLLHAAEWYSADDVPTLSAFAALAVPALLTIIASWPATAPT
jgi:transcriptional regulator with GAF, ATPase, and Fis domain